MLHLGDRAEDLSVKRGVIPLHAFADLLGDRKITVKKIILDQATDDNVVSPLSWWTMVRSTCRMVGSFWAIVAISMLPALSDCFLATSSSTLVWK